MVHLHAGFKLSRTNSHKCDTVSVSLVHICLDLKYKCGEILVKWIYYAGQCFSWKRRCGHFQKMLQECFNTEVGQRRTKEYRGKITLLYTVHIQFIAGTV